jgi:hypothetical protein
VDALWLPADFPRLFHAAEAGAWESIQQFGLRSTTALLDLYEVDPERRIALERRHRPNGVPLSLPGLPSVVLRDQKPLNVEHLRGCLEDGVTVEEWLLLLNSKVFFWATEDRLSRLLKAAAYRDRMHDVLVVDTRSLVERYAEKITLTRINSGATGRARARRGRRTFVPISLYPDDPASRRRIAEVAVEYAVLDIAEHVQRVERRQGDRVLETLIA